jgi:hypothetical protein
MSLPTREREEFRSALWSRLPSHTASPLDHLLAVYQSSNFGIHQFVLC